MTQSDRNPMPPVGKDGCIRVATTGFDMRLRPKREVQGRFLASIDMAPKGSKAAAVRIDFNLDPKHDAAENDRNSHIHFQPSGENGGPHDRIVIPAGKIPLDEVLRLLTDPLTFRKWMDRAGCPQTGQMVKPATLVNAARKIRTAMTAATE